MDTYRSDFRVSGFRFVLQVQDGILKCPKCKSMKTSYVEVQTRSADEPTTKKCLCTDCTYRWKFC